MAEDIGWANEILSRWYPSLWILTSSPCLWFFNESTINQCVWSFKLVSGRHQSIDTIESSCLEEEEMNYLFDDAENTGVRSDDDDQWNDQSHGKHVQDVGSVIVHFGFPVHRAAAKQRFIIKQLASYQLLYYLLILLMMTSWLAISSNEIWRGIASSQTIKVSV